ncbi:MAG TPA: tRNA pseudouridine(38-40) synthase TruA [Rectinemataceae bacterium]|nr:tRNA pseudouridine(38-40) synthase TruA [Rectinemataceae bacterium]
MTSRNIKLVLSYDGTDFGGWQRQDNARSVQEELERALAAMHGHPVHVTGAGRTDAGVHAMGQAANFYTDIASIPASRFVPALNHLLPHDLRVLDSSEVDPDFHARFDARLRRYRYFILCDHAADPMRLRYSHHVRRIPDIESLNAMAALLPGEHDFTTFSSARDPSASRSRYVHEASFRWEGGFLVFQIAANAFLWRMVRSLVGSLLAYEAEAASSAPAAGGPAAACPAAPAAAARMSAALAARDRSLAGPTAPARALFLWNVEYYARPTRPGSGSRRAGGDAKIVDDPE